MAQHILPRKHGRAYYTTIHDGAATHSRMSLTLATFSITLSIQCHYANCRVFYCNDISVVDVTSIAFFMVAQRVVGPSVVRLNVLAPTSSTHKDLYGTCPRNCEEMPPTSPNYMPISVTPLTHN